ncbi:hypothetical protein E6C67_03815 (plasmid) [Azospirillum sp. TSA2s]|uniref:EexN family lipoprotein n=1 Tax=Azospirillum sp. TSA2s TaxID=709810 RepID=UPI0010AAC5BF|nr:EexN family lipoprotein [Azospirillum sp. TSA2s]QCG93079.1 hypothetical protein E6C67_03815 [Azospirillum sp. TSA2s]
MTIPLRTPHLLPAVLALTVLIPAPSGVAAAPRSVGWYADHPQERAQVQLACFDDPGRLGRDPDCVNAQQASVEVALRQARARTGTMDPNDPEFWSNSPENRKSKLIMCRRTPTLDHCEAARRSLLIEAGQAGR